MTKKISLNVLSIVVCAAAFLIGAWVVIFKYFHFSYFDWDLAFFSQAAWNLCHGTQYTSLVGINYFGDHSYYITFLILPVFALFPHPLTLVFLKLAAFILSGQILYRIIRQDVGEWSALILMVLYLVFPANIFALLYEFNIEAFAPIFLLLMFDFFRRERYLSFIIASLLLCLIKENMPLVVFMFGLVALVTRKKDPIKWGWIPMGASVIVFIILVFWVIPFFRAEPSHAFWVRYQHILEHPLRFLSKVVTGNVGYIADLFGPLLLPVLIAPQNIFFVAPIFAQHILSNEVSEHTIYYHYGLTLTPFIFLAAAAGLAKSRQFLKGKAYVAVLIFLVLFTISHTLRFASDMKSRFVVHKDSLAAVRWSMIHKIPTDAKVIATFDFLAPLSLRKYLYSFHMVYDDFYQDPSEIAKGELHQNRIFKLPTDVDYALIDMNDQFLVREFKSNPEIISRRVDDFLKDWVVVDRQGTILLMRRRGSLDRS